MGQGSQGRRRQRQRFGVSPSDTYGHHRAVVGITGHAADHFRTGRDFLRHQHRPPERLSRDRDFLGRIQSEGDATHGGFVGGSIHLDHDGKSQVLGRGDGFLGSPGQTPVRHRDAVALHDLRGLVFGQSAGTQEIGHVHLLMGVKVAGSEGVPRRDRGDRLHRSAGPSQQGDTVCCGETRDPTRRIGDVHSGHGRKDATILGRLRQSLHDGQTPIVFRVTPVLGDIHLGQQDIKLTRMCHQFQRFREDHFRFVDHPRVQWVGRV